MPNFSGLWSSTQQFQAVGGNTWPSLPGAPTIGTASVASSTSASVAFTAPGNTGYPAGITGYTVTSSPGGLTGTGASSPITVAGLTTGTAYTFTVKATNATGTGPSSAASNSITPPFTYVEDVFSTFTYTGTGTSATNNQVIDNDVALVSTATWKTRTILDGTTTYIYKVKKDTSGNYIVLGNSIVSGIYRVLVIKFDSTWNILWQKRISQDATSQTVSAEALALDPSNNIYVALGNEGAAASLVKLNSSGDLQWARAIEPSSGSGRYLNTVLYNTVDGFLYVGGRTSGPGGPGLYAKYNTSGTIQWMYKYKPAGTYYGNQQYGHVKSMAHDSAGNVYMAGLEFDGGWKGIVVKINSSGTFQWNKRVSNTSSGIDSIFIDSSDGIYIGYYDSASFSGSSYASAEVHTTKLNTSGAIVWDRKFVGYPGGPGIAAIAGDSSGGIYTNLFATIIKHNSSGTFQWSRKVHPNPGTVGFYGVSVIDSTLYGTGITNPSTTGFITELALDGSTTSGTAYHTITGDVLDSAGSQTLSAGNSEVEAHTGPEQASTATLSTASTTVTTYTQDAVTGFGGLVWTKGRSDGYSHGLFDTTRGADYWLNSASTAVSTSISAVPANPWISSFNIDGFTVGTNGSTNNSGTTYASWTFRKQPKFFDIVTYTGNGVNGRNVSHNLGSVPGCLFIKRTDTVGDWIVGHRSVGLPRKLNSTDASFANSGVIDTPSNTSTTFYIKDDDLVNANGGTYVAYLFAHDAGGFGASGNENIISCGSYTGNGSATGPEVNLGYEPQWVLIKEVTQSGNAWSLYDNIRGLSVSAPSGHLRPNASDTEDSTTVDVRATSTGFQPISSSTRVNRNGETFIYMAIRKGPMKTPTDATKVFLPLVYTGNGGTNNLTSGFPVDFMINKNKDSTGPDFTVVDRLRGFGTASDSTKYLFTNNTDAEGSASNGVTAMGNTGLTLGSWSQTNFSSTSYINWMFRRAPGFFDEVCYTGTGSNTTQAHNLGVAPELIIIKARSFGQVWVVGTTAIGFGNYLLLNTTDATASGSNVFNSTAPTSTVFSLGTGTGGNQSTSTYVAYLFATCAGVSKVGSYTGTGTTLNIDCGFTAGARFVLIKRTDSTGNWFVWDTARGIVSGNDPYLLFNDDAAEVTNTDYIDPYSPGFTLSSTAPVALNASGGTYIFLAIA